MQTEKGFGRLAIIAVLCVGCSKSASGPTFARTPIPPGMGLVHVYRPSAMSGGGRSIFISMPFEANNCFALDNGGYLTYVARPGVVTIGASGSGEMRAFPVSVGAGGEAYVRVEWGTWGSAELKAVSAADGAREIGSTRGIAACSR